MTTKRRKPSAIVQTFTGKYIDLLDFKPSDFDLGDMLASLSMTNRFNGHTATPVSVLSHMHACGEIALALLDGKLVYDPALKKKFDKLKPRRGLAVIATIMHDAAEAYIGDIVSPLKQHLPEIIALEKNVMDAIHERLGISVDADMAEFVKFVDGVAVSLEAGYYMTPPANGDLTPWKPADPRVSSVVITKRLAEILLWIWTATPEEAIEIYMEKWFSPEDIVEVYRARKATLDAWVDSQKGGKDEQLN